MKSRRNLPLILALVCMLFWLLLDAVKVRGTVLEGLQLCVKSVIPSLFPFLVVSSLLTSLGFGELLAGPLSGLMRLYQIGGVGASALVLGLIGGYPVGPRTVAELYHNHLLSKDEANRLLTFCNNANPAFLINTLGVGIFGSVRIGLFLWLIHLLAALLTGLILGRKSSTASRTPWRETSLRAVRFPEAFVGAVRSGLTAILSICAFVVFFYVAALPLRAIGGTVGTLLAGSVELFSAVPQIPPTLSGFVLASALAGWGGICVHFQTLAVLSESGLDTKNCITGKAVQCALSALISLLLANYIL